MTNPNPGSFRSLFPPSSSSSLLTFRTSSRLAVLAAANPLHHGAVAAVQCGDHVGPSRYVVVMRVSRLGPAHTTLALRIRPTTQHDLSSIPTRFQRNIITALSNTTVSVDVTPSSGPGAPAAPVSSSANSAKKQQFTFDQVHPPSTTQHAMFTSTAQPLISRFVEGFNCTILAYGQTSSGKTFTMTGIDLDANPMDPNNGMGIIPRAVSTIFSRCRELKEERGGTWNYSIKGSYIELYNEDLIDLLAESGGKRDVQIREDKQGHIIWEGLREVNVKNANEVQK